MLLLSLDGAPFGAVCTFSGDFVPVVFIKDREETSEAGCRVQAASSQGKCRKLLCDTAPPTQGCSFLSNAHEKEQPKLRPPGETAGEIQMENYA